MTKMVRVVPFFGKKVKQVRDPLLYLPFDW